MFLTLLIYRNSIARIPDIHFEMAAAWLLAANINPPFQMAKRQMETKLNVIAGALLQLAFWDFASAADEKSDECGLASIYSTASEETASGEDTRAENLTAAHRSLPFETMVRVDNQENGRSAVVRITDRGPFIRGRIIDVSQIAARELGIFGLTQVCLNVLSLPERHWRETAP